MVYFTPKYKQVHTLMELPMSVNISVEDNSRWICYQYRTVCGKNYEYTLIDNYLEIYRITWSPDLAELNSTDNSVSIVYNYDSIPESIYLSHHTNSLKNLALPDFAIDVLETVENNISFEVIGRIVAAFHAKMISLKPEPISYKSFD